MIDDKFAWLVGDELETVYCAVQLTSGTIEEQFFFKIIFQLNLTFTFSWIKYKIVTWFFINIVLIKNKNMIK